MIGQTLGHYQIVAKIGEGGMGEVYQARDTRLDRDVALKVLPEAFTSDPDRLARFEREAKVLASLNHPNIGHIYGLEEAEPSTSDRSSSGQVVRALVLELVEGPTLADRIKQGPIPIDEALPIATQIAEALEAAHELGVIHRDLKPANIKLKPDGTVKVLDFGLAKALDPAPEGDPSQSPTLTAAATQMGVVLGTAAYMAPEQAKGKQVDRRADIWAFGCVLFEMLAARPPFPGTDVSEVLAAVIRAEPDWSELPVNLAVRLRRLVERCLQKDLRRRQQSVADARLELEELAEAPAGTVMTVPRADGLARRVGVTGVVAGVVLGAGLTVALLPRSDAADTLDGVTRFSIPLRPDQTNTEVLDSYPSSMVAIAPDGSTLALIGGQRHSLHVRAIDELGFRQISGTDGARNPFFAPDGNQVAFFTKVTGELRTISLAEGSQPQTLVDGIPGSDWAFGSWGDDDVIVLAGPDTGLFRVTVRQRSLEPLTSPPDMAHNYPQILPGSRAVLFNTQEGDTTTVQALDIHDPNAAPVTLFADASHPHYLSSGHLLFAREGGLWVAPFDIESLSVGVPVSVPLRVIFDAPEAHDPTPQLAVSRTGTLVYAVGSGAVGQSGRLVWTDRGGRVLEDLGPAPGGLPGLQLSPDEMTLAVEYRDGADVVVGLFDLQRRILEAELLRRRQIFTGMPVWTSDASQLIVSQPGVAEGTMLAVDVTGSTGRSEVFTTSGSWLFAHSLSSDGQRLLFNVDPPDAGMSVGVFEFGETGNADNPRLLLTGATNYFSPSWSPDGRAFAYVEDVDGSPEVWAKPYPTGAARRVSPDGGWAPLWSPDGAELFYLRDNGNEVWAAGIEVESEVRVGAATMLFAGSYQPSGDTGYGYDVSDDGQRFLMVQTDPTEWIANELVVVTNWLEELERLVPVD